MTLPGSCQCRPLSCALCLLEWAAWERAHEADLEPYWETDLKTGERYLDVSRDDAGDALYRTSPKVAPASTIAAVGGHLAVAVCYRHLAVNQT